MRSVPYTVDCHTEQILGYARALEVLTVPAGPHEARIREIVAGAAWEIRSLVAP